MADVDLKSILQRDVDDVLAFGRDVSGRDRTRVLHAAIRSLQESDDPLCRLKALTLIQTLLSQTPKGRLAVSLASTLARTLSAIVSHVEEIVDLRLSAISGLMLLIVKIRSTTQ